MVFSLVCQNSNFTCEPTFVSLFLQIVITKLPSPSINPLNAQGFNGILELCVSKQRLTSLALEVNSRVPLKFNWLDKILI